MIQNSLKKNPENLKKFIIFISFLGLVPFIFGYFDLWYNYPNLMFKINIPKNYGVIIFTFLGSLYWGLIIQNKGSNHFSCKLKILTIIWSITPSIIGINILSINSNLSIIILTIGFFISQIIDELYINLFGFPKWYINLRRILTLIVTIILICSYLIITRI